MSIRTTLHPHLEVQEDIESDSIRFNDSISRPMGLGLGLVQDVNEEAEGETEDQYQGPESRNLLPPLPSSHSPHTIPDSKNAEQAVTSDTTDTPLTSPLSYVASPLTSQSNLTSELELSMDNTNSPKHKKSTRLPTTIGEAVDEVLNYSPAINIQERFEVCLEIPLINEANAAPRTIEEKIRLYENVQKKEILEFDKTLNNLKSSGWMTENEISQLESSKCDNFNRWETKIKSLKSSIRKTPSIDHASLSDGALHVRQSDDFCNSSQRTTSKPTKESVLTSPTLQNLERQFSSLNI